MMGETRRARRCSRGSACVIAGGTVETQFWWEGPPQTVPARWNFLPSIGKHLPIFLGPSNVQWHNFSGKSDSAFKRYAVLPAIPRGTMGGTLSDTNPVKGFVKCGIALLHFLFHFVCLLVRFSIF